MFYGLLEYITDEQVKILCCKHARRFAYPLEVYFKYGDFSKFYRLIVARGPDRIPSTSGLANKFLTFYDIGLHLSTICKHSTMHEALIIHSARSCVNSKLVAELEILTHSSTDIGIQLNAHLLLARHDESRIPQAVSVSHEYHCLPVEIEFTLASFRQRIIQMSLLNFQIAHKILFLLSLDDRTLLNAYEEILGIHRGETDECYLEQLDYHEYLEGNLVSDCYLLPHQNPNQKQNPNPYLSIWRPIFQNLQNMKFNPDIDRMHIISSIHLLSSIKEYLKNSLRMIITTSYMDIIESSLCKETGKGFNPADISYSLECCQLMLLVHDSAVRLLREYHSIEGSHYFPLCTNFVPWVQSIEIGFNHLQLCAKKSLLRELSQAEHHFDFLKLWEQASVVKLTPIFRRFLEKSSAAKYKVAIEWIDVCNEVIHDPLKSCSKFVRDCLPKLDINCYSSIIDSISVYGTIILAMLSCVSNSSSPIIIPHMYYRALQVYDSLLPKAQNENILDSCSNQIGHIIQSDPASHYGKLLQCLHSALNQIEVLLQNQSDFYSQSMVQISDLPRLTIILILTLYMNYTRLSETPDSSDLRSKFVHHLKELQLKLTFQHFYDFDLLAVCNAFQEAKNPLSLVSILKYLLCPDSKQTRYESLAIIYFSKCDKKIVIENIDDDDIKLPPEIQLSDEQLNAMPISPLISKHKRQQHLYFSLSCKHVYHGPIRAESSPPVWMHYKECSEDVHKHVRAFIHQVISKDPALASTIRDKTLFQQYLHCLHHLKAIYGSINV